MSREKEDYRANLEILNTRFPDYDMLSAEEIMQVTGFTSRTTIRKFFGAKMVGGRLSKAALARYMCG